LKQQRLTKEVEAKRLANESARREEARIQKEIEEKELEEARALLAEVEKWKAESCIGLDNCTHTRPTVARGQLYPPITHPWHLVHTHYPPIYLDYYTTSHPIIC